DLQPARQFPADGAAGEGFTNAAEALAEISPTLLNKYLAAAKDIADHAVLLPDGFRFSATKTRRDWLDECLAQLRQAYARYTGADGRLPVRPYVLATLRHRDALSSGQITIDAVAAKEKLSSKYLQDLWQTLTNQNASFPLDGIRTRWRTASEKDVDALASDIAAWQGPMWRYVPIGSYRDRQMFRQVSNDTAATGNQSLRGSVKPVPGQGDVVLYLTARAFAAGGGHGIWDRPRFGAHGAAPV